VEDRCGTIESRWDFLVAIKTLNSANHSITQEGDDFFIYRFGAGNVTAEDLEKLMELERVVWATTHIYSMTCLDDNLKITPGALTRAAKLFQHSPPRTSSFVVRRHYLRTAMEFLIRTLRLLGAQVDIGFFEAEDEARAWIEQKRSERFSGSGGDQEKSVGL